MIENSEVPLQTSKVKIPSAILLLCIPNTNTPWIQKHRDSMLPGIYLEVYSIEFSLTQRFYGCNVYPALLARSIHVEHQALPSPA